MTFKVTDPYDWRDTEWMKYYLRKWLKVSWNMWKTVEYTPAQLDGDLEFE